MCVSVVFMNSMDIALVNVSNRCITKCVTSPLVTALVSPVTTTSNAPQLYAPPLFPTHSGPSVTTTTPKIVSWSTRLGFIKLYFGPFPLFNRLFSDHLSTDGKRFGELSHYPSCVFDWRRCFRPRTQ